VSFAHVPKIKPEAPIEKTQIPKLANAPVGSNDPSRVKILVVEDNAVNQKLIVTVLQKHGYNVTLANNGEEAIEISAEKTFDLILMDLQMPKRQFQNLTKDS
jgi:PleD family two-component response regulator